MFGYALRHPLKPGNQYVENKAGLTCLTLACYLGRDELFKEMLELSCKEFWRYSNICAAGYPLGALDSIKPSGETSKFIYHMFGCFSPVFLIILILNTGKYINKYDLIFRLELSHYDNLSWNETGAFEYVRGGYHCKAVGREMEHLCQGECILFESSNRIIFQTI